MSAAASLPHFLHFAFGAFPNINALKEYLIFILLDYAVVVFVWICQVNKDLFFFFLIIFHQFLSRPSFGLLHSIPQQLYYLL